jgi:hypothetical protein
MARKHYARAFLLLVAILSVSILHGQTQGEITGEITDTSGAVVPGASVTVTNEGTNVSRRVITNAAGTYSFPSLLPATYRLRVEKTGFQSEERGGIELQVQQVARIDFRMEVGQVSETLNITATAPLLATENATTGTVIENKRIVDLPLNGRNFLQLVALSPNVSSGFGSSGLQATVVGGQRAAQNISVAGQRGEFNHFTLDGIENTDNSFNVYVFLPSIDALEEFKVQTGVYPAEFGRSVSQINVSTKSGTNGYHGTLFEFFRNSKMDANDFGFTSVAPVKNALVRNQYGFTLGGPVVIPRVFNGKDRLFFMANYEALRNRTGVHQIASVPPAAMRNGDFSGIPQVVYDPATRVQTGNTITAQPFLGNIIPASRFSGKALTLFQYYPLPNVPVAGLVNNYQQLIGERQDADQFTARIDFAESARSTWFGRWSWDDEFSTNPATFPNQGQKVLANAQQAMISNTRVLSPATVNEFRFGYNRLIDETLQDNAFVNNVVGQIGGIPGIAAPTPIIWGIPSIGIAGFSGFGDLASAPYLGHTNIFEWIDNFSINRGKHSIRFGGEIRRDQYNQSGNQFPRGSFSFSGQATQNPQSASNTGSGLADYLLGLVRTSSGALGLAVAQLRGTRQYYYIDDSWKIRPNLTLSLGLRYELAPPYVDKHNNMINVQLPSLFDANRRPTLVRAGSGDFFQGLPFVFPSAVQVARDSRLGDALVQTYYKGFAPRIGLAYSATSRWTIRGGFGLFYAQDIGNVGFDLARNLAVRRTANADPNFPTNLTLDNPFLSQGTVLVTAPLPLGQCYCNRLPYVLQYLFNIQRQLTNDSVLEIGYTGNEGHRLDHYYGANFPLPGPGNVQSRRPYPELANIFYLESGINSNYNALTAKLTERFSRGFTALVSYTFSKSIDNGSSVRARSGDPSSENQQNPYDMRAERAASVFNASQRLVVSLLWEAPLGKGKLWLSSGVPSFVLGDWQMGSIFTAASGFPFTVTSGIDDANIGGNSTQRPNYSGVPLAPPGGKDPQEWFNPAAFTRVPQYTFGMVGRNTVIGPDLFEWDFSAMKNFPMPVESHKLQFRLEAFNIPNRPNFSIPNSNLLGASFGKITSTATNMRQLQLSLKYIF